jgi:hypothetical protein
MFCFSINTFLGILIILGDLYEEQDILNWLLTQKDPSGDIIDEVNGEELLAKIHESEALAVYFCKTTFYSKLPSIRVCHRALFRSQS